MNTNLLTIAGQLSDNALIAKLKLLAQGSRQTTVELIANLAELAARKLHRAEGPGSLFGYCTEILRFSEAAACNRIRAAKAARKFPVILDLLADGSVNLTTVRLLAPHLTAENHRAVLAEATGKRKRQVAKIVARLAPQPDVPPSIRKLPASRPSVNPAEAVVANTLARQEKDGSVGAPSLSETSAQSSGTEGSAAVTAAPPTTHRPVVAPLSPRRYRVEFTIGEEAEEELRRLQDLLRGEIPNGDLGAIFVRGIKLQLQEAEKKKFAATSKPRPGRGTKPGSRHVPAEVQRKVWRRDGGRCAFVAKNGRRCTERSYIEFHHANEPYAFGGEATVENISLRCRSHNVYESELIFGPYDASRVREAQAVYGAIAPRTGSGTSWSVPRIYAPEG